MKRAMSEGRIRRNERENRGKLVIRPARPLDAPVVSFLMYYSNPKLALYLFGEPENNVIRIFHDLFQIPNHMFSYTQAFVAEYDDKIVGSVFGFDGRTRKSLELAMIERIGFRWLRIVRFRRIPHMIRAIIDLEKVTPPISDEDYYVYMLAVLPDMRRKGVGTRLIEFVQTLARSKGLKRVALDVETNNDGARRFYEHSGYQISKIVIDSGFLNRSGVVGAIRMVKPLNPT